MAEVVAPSVRMGGKKMWIVKPEAGYRIVVRRKSSVRKNRISRKIAAAGRRVVSAGRVRGPPRGPHPPGRPSVANKRPRRDGRVKPGRKRPSPRSGGDER